MFSEIFLAALAGKIVDKALDALAQRTGVQEVRRVLTGDPARAALIRALRNAYAGLEERYPYLASKDFHEIFFRQDEVIDELARVISRRAEEGPSAKRLAELARAQYELGHGSSLETLLPAAKFFLKRFEEEVRKEPELRPFFDSRALERLHEIAAIVRTAYPRVPYREEARALLDFYTERFVGREEAVEAVTAFTAQKEGGYLLIEAGPGMGKTALIAQLVHRYEQGTWQPGGVEDHPPLLYVFLRQERGWHTPISFLAALNSQLLDVLGIPGGVPTDVEALGRLFTILWGEAAAYARPDRPLTLLVDGLDEIVPDERNRTVAHFLPDHLPPCVHVVVTSRPQPKAFDWVPSYHPLKKAQVYRLARFGPQEVRALLAQAGDTLSRDEAFIQKLVDLTGGEPLFLRFLCEDVAAWGKEAEARLAALPSLEGVEDYFREQLALLAERAEGEDIRHILGMLVVARGGMTADELADALGIPKKHVLDVLEPIRRFLLGEERVELMHLEFRRMVEGWFTQRELRDYRDQLLDYCARWREHGSDFALSHYAAHLFEAGRYEELYGLIDREWMELKRRRTGSHRGFAIDVELVFRAAEEEGVKGLPRLVQCALVSATLGSLATRIPVEALGTMARLGQVGRALDYARLVVNPRQKAEALSAIATALVGAGRMEEALEVARSIGDPEEEARALSDIATALVEAERVEEAREVLEEALEVARSIGEPEEEARALSDIATALVEAERVEEAREVLEEALEVARSIEKPQEGTRALSSVARAWMQTEQRERALAVTYEAFRVVLRGGRGTAFACLGDFAPILAGFGPEVLAEAWRLVKKVESWWR